MIHILLLSDRNGSFSVSIANRFSLSSTDLTQLSHFKDNQFVKTLTSRINKYCTLKRSLFQVPTSEAESCYYFLVNIIPSDDFAGLGSWGLMFILNERKFRNYFTGMKEM